MDEAKQLGGQRYGGRWVEDDHRFSLMRDSNGRGYGFERRLELQKQDRCAGDVRLCRTNIGDRETRVRARRGKYLLLAIAADLYDGNSGFGRRIACDV